MNRYALQDVAGFMDAGTLLNYVRTNKDGDALANNARFRKEWLLGHGYPPFQIDSATQFTEFLASATGPAPGKQVDTLEEWFAMRRNQLLIKKYLALYIKKYSIEQQYRIDITKEQLEQVFGLEGSDVKSHVIFDNKDRVFINVYESDVVFDPATDSFSNVKRLKKQYELPDDPSVVMYQLYGKLWDLIRADSFLAYLGSKLYLEINDAIATQFREEALKKIGK